MKHFLCIAVAALLLSAGHAAAQLYPMLSTTSSRTVTGGATNLALLTFTNNFTGPNTLTNSANVFAGSGAGLTGLVASAYLPLAGGTMSGATLIPAGSVSAASIALSDSASTGLYKAGTATFGIASGGSGVMCWGPYAGPQILGTVPLSWSSAGLNSLSDVFLYRDEAAALGLRNATTAQSLRVYGTYTDASNLVRASLSATSTSVTLAAETAGTGADDVNINLTPAGAGGVVIGSGGAAITKVLSASATLDFDLSAVVVEDLTITVTGAAVGDVVSLGVPNGSVTATVQFTGWVSASDTVTVRARTSAAGEDPASGTFRATVIKH